MIFKKSSSILLCALIATAPSLHAGDVLVNGSGKAKGNKSVVVAGKKNKALKGAAGVLAGRKNKARGAASVVAGGQGNLAGGTASGVFAGGNNQATGIASGVLSGTINLAVGFNSAVTGGQSNTASGTNAGVHAGQSNQAIGIRSGVLAGLSNQARGSAAAVAGGQSNRANGARSGVLAGLANTASGADAVVLGGRSNTANGTGSLLHGTRLNAAGLAGSVLLSDSDPGNLRSGAPLEPGTANQFNAQFLGGYALMVDDGTEQTNGMVVVPSAYPGTGSEEVYVGVNTGLPQDGGGPGVESGPQAPLHVRYDDEGSLLDPDGLVVRGAARFGDFFGFNLAISDGEIQAYNGSSQAVLYLNDFGGGVNISSDNSASGTVNIGATTNAVGVNLFGTVNIGTAHDGTNDGSDVTIGGADSNVTINGNVTTPSDRNIKEGFAEVDRKAVLGRLMDVPVETWKYIGNNERRHFGPMAQDFHAAFDDFLGLRSDETTIAPLDVNGVTIAAIQALKEEVDEKDRKIEELSERLEKLETALGGEGEEERR